MPIVEGVVQQSVDWLQMRCGIVTASRVPDLVAKLKNGKPSASREKYMKELICENLTGRATDRYVTQAMEHGIEFEPQAIAAYEVAVDVIADDGGFALHPKIGKFGASIDRLVGKDGGVNAKCPTSTTHLDWLMAGVIPEEYEPQMLAEIACYELEWCDFISFDPRMPGKLQLFVRRLHRDEKKIKAMEDEVCRFLEELAENLRLLSDVELMRK